MYCDNEEDRRDLFQEVLIQLWKSYASYRGEAKFSTWMYRVSFNVAIQHLRKQKRKPLEISLTDKFEKIPDQSPVPSWQQQRLKQAIAQLNTIEKTIILLYLEDIGNEEIAEIMGITQNHVRVKMSRIRTTLRSLIKT